MDDLTLTPECVLSVMLYLCDGHHSDYSVHISTNAMYARTPRPGSKCTSCTYRDYITTRPRYPASEVVFDLLCTVYVHPGPSWRLCIIERVINTHPTAIFAPNIVTTLFYDIIGQLTFQSFPNLENITKQLDKIKYQQECDIFDAKAAAIKERRIPHLPLPNCLKSDNIGKGTAAKNSKKTQSKNKATPKKVEAVLSDCTSNKVMPSSKHLVPACTQTENTPQVHYNPHVTTGPPTTKRPSFDSYIRARVWTSSTSQTEHATAEASTQCSFNVSVTDLRIRRGNLRTKQLFDELPYKKKHNLEYYLRRTYRRNNKHINASSGYGINTSPVNGYTVDLKPSYIILTIM